MTALEKLKYFRDSVKTFENWHKFALFITHANSNAELKYYKNNEKISVAWINANDLEMNTKNGRFILDKNSFGFYEEIFINQAYAKLNVKNEVVLDLGAGIGDTARYFLNNKATRVIAYEPSRYAYAYLTMNCTGLPVECVPAGVGEKQELFTIAEERTNGAYSLVNNPQGTAHVMAYPLAFIVKRHKLENAILKMDVEGAEHEVIASSDKQTLRTFKEISIEIHGDKSQIIEKLINSGFKYSLETNETCGSVMLHATRQGD